MMTGLGSPPHPHHRSHRNAFAFSTSSDATCPNFLAVAGAYSATTNTLSYPVVYIIGTAGQGTASLNLATGAFNVRLPARLVLPRRLSLFD